MNTASATFDLQAANRVRFVPRAPTVEKASADFWEACRKHLTTSKAIQDDECGIMRIAHRIRHDLTMIEEEANALNMARLGCDNRGLPVRAEPFRAADVDMVALVQLLFPNMLTGGAEKLLVAHLSAVA